MQVDPSTLIQISRAQINEFKQKHEQSLYCHLEAYINLAEQQDTLASSSTDSSVSQAYQFEAKETRKIIKKIIDELTTKFTKWQQQLSQDNIQESDLLAIKQQVTLHNNGRESEVNNTELRKEVDTILSDLQSRRIPSPQPVAEQLQMGYSSELPPRSSYPYDECLKCTDASDSTSLSSDITEETPTTAAEVTEALKQKVELIEKYKGEIEQFEGKPLYYHLETYFKLKELYGEITRHLEDPTHIAKYQAQTAENDQKIREISIQLISVFEYWQQRLYNELPSIQELDLLNQQLTTQDKGTQAPPAQEQKYENEFDAQIILLEKLQMEIATKLTILRQNTQSSTAPASNLSVAAPKPTRSNDEAEATIANLHHFVNLGFFSDPNDPDVKEFTEMKSPDAETTPQSRSNTIYDLDSIIDKLLSSKNIADLIGEIENLTAIITNLERRTQGGDSKSENLKLNTALSDAKILLDAALSYQSVQQKNFYQADIHYGLARDKICAAGFRDKKTQLKIKEIIKKHKDSYKISPSSAVSLPPALQPQNSSQISVLVENSLEQIISEKIEPENTSPETTYEQNMTKGNFISLRKLQHEMGVNQSQPDFSTDPSFDETNNGNDDWGDLEEDMTDDDVENAEGVEAEDESILSVQEHKGGSGNIEEILISTAQMQKDNEESSKAENEPIPLSHQNNEDTDSKNDANSSSDASDGTLRVAPESGGCESDVTLNETDTDTPSQIPQQLSSKSQLELSTNLATDAPATSSSSATGAPLCISGIIVSSSQTDSSSSSPNTIAAVEESTPIGTPEAKRAQNRNSPPSPRF